MTDSKGARREEDAIAINGPTLRSQIGCLKPLPRFLQKFSRFWIKKRNGLDFSKYLFHFLADTIMNFSADAVERRRRTSSVTNCIDGLSVRVNVLNFPAASAEDNPLPWGERPFNWKRSQYVSLGDQTKLFSRIKGAVEIKLIDKLFAEYSR
jgi:hypothetical protein